MVMSMNEQHLKLSKIIGIIIVAILVIFYVMHHLTKKTPPAIPAPKVIIQKPVVADVVDYIHQTGTSVAYNSVNLVARIEGYLEAIKFVDGSFVKKGQELFVVEPQPYLEKLKEAQATVAAQKANYAYAKSEYARQKRMYSQNATSLNNVEIWLAKTQEAEADVAKAIANQEIASINYSYTHVVAPFDGRIGRHLIDIGNLVGNGKATNLATLEQISPIYIYFNLNELDLIKLRAAAKERGLSPSDISKIPAYVRMQNETDFKHRGKLDFVNTGLNASTGTLEFRVLLENKDYFFIPGLFVEVRVPVSKPRKLLTVPDAALMYDQSGPYLMVVDKDNIVQVKRVTLGVADHGKRPILSGLDASDNVIARGLQFATPGNKVEPSEPS